jgi:hypothetical protein
VQREAEARGVYPGGLDLLADHEVVAEVVDPAAAVLLGHCHAQEPVTAGLAEHLAVDDARLLPLEVVRDHLLVEELAEAGPEEVVLLVEQRAAHGPTVEGGRVRSGR